MHEEELRNGPGRWYCFSCAESPDRAAALILLQGSVVGEIRVGNIIPRNAKQLSIGEYNQILEEFAERYVRPATIKTGVVMEISEADFDLKHRVTRKTADKLRTFSKMANKCPGALHAADREAWKEFLVAAHEEGSKLDPGLLGRWLVEVEHWSSESAEALVAEYQQARDLLAYLNTRRSA